MATSVREQIKEVQDCVSVLDLLGQPRAVILSVSVLEMGNLRLAGVSLDPLR